MQQLYYFPENQLTKFSAAWTIKAMGRKWDTFVISGW